MGRRRQNLLREPAESGSSRLFKRRNAAAHNGTGHKKGRGYNNGYSEFDISPSGTFVYLAGSIAAANASLFWLAPSGKPQLLPAPSANYALPRASPDGSRIAVEVRDGSSVNLAVYDWARNTMSRLTFLKSGAATNQIWAPDGKHLVFFVGSQELSGSGIYWMRSDGAGEPERLLEGSGLQPTSFSRDGERFAYYVATGTDYGIWTVRLDLSNPEHPKAGKAELFLGSKATLRNPVLSPDGRWIAYDSLESGQAEIYVRPFPGPGGRWKIPIGGSTIGNMPYWSRNGRELFIARPEGVWVTSYSVKGDVFSADQPRPWATGLLLGGVPDLMPDGKRFIAVLPSSAATSGEVAHATFLLNFADELRRRVPLK